MVFSVGDVVRVNSSFCDDHNKEVTLVEVGNGRVGWKRGSATHSGHEQDVILVKPKGALVGKIVDKIKFMDLSAEDKVLRKQGFVDAEGRLTSEGREALELVTFEANKKALVEYAKAIEAEEKAEKKSA